MGLNLGIVGAGRAGIRRARRFESIPDVHVVAIADPSRPARDAFAQTFGTRLAVSDHRRLIADSLVDAVCVCSPPATHSAIAVDALQAGKHVICEEPMAVSIGQADEMVEAAQSTGKRLLVTLPARYDPANQEVARLIRDDAVGYPFLALSRYIENEFDRLNDWHDWKGTWEMGGGGILSEHGSNAIDLLRYFLGDIETVSAICTRFAISPLNKAEDSCLLGIEFRGEATAEVALTGAVRYNVWSEASPGNTFRTEIYGLNGSILVSDAEPRLTVVLANSKPKTMYSQDIETDLPVDMELDFVDCILSGKEPLVTAEDARDALKVVLAGYKASQMKRRVEILYEHL